MFESVLLPFIRNLFFLSLKRKLRTIFPENEVIQGVNEEELKSSLEEIDESDYLEIQNTPEAFLMIVKNVKISDSQEENIDLNGTVQNCFNSKDIQKQQYIFIIENSDQVTSDIHIFFIIPFNTYASHLSDALTFLTLFLIGSLIFTYLSIPIQ